jgi:hypothetical protein
MYGAIGDQRLDVPMTEFFKIITARPGGTGGGFRARKRALGNLVVRRLPLAQP